MNAIPVKKANNSGVPRIQFVDLNISSRDYVRVSRLAKRED